ncbi:hypothetical protein PVAND_012023 [Polypedilum vanderplanki]|uniref:Uncharacterized protein n=1 Tax=Polypedilum vanderplanki TaxID=319348 RepID=A0A9J6CL70_POLVA|nr:hypothetical protein PVAND_012023 [Polypedilum vanderplanki]
MGVVFLVVVPTEKYEKVLKAEIYNADIVSAAKNYNIPAMHKNDLNVPDENPNAILRMEVELRDKNQPAKKRGKNKGKQFAMDLNVQSYNNVDIPMEKILDDLLKKLEMEHVVWYSDKTGNYFQVIFPTASGEPCETTLHCLVELGIGKKFNSSVSILPCSVSYDATNDTSNEEDYDENENSKWNEFVESIKSKLTVKQVVDGVRSGGSLTFDYLLLIVTADSLAALGLVENNASNIVAAMLVSPLMGPVMSITFGSIISDWKLVRVGFISLALGMFISVLFGFIFGLILGTTEMPWGNGDFPTEEMKGRGNARSLWMGVLWALTSGSGVAVALLQGSAGPLIGVAISASLLPPVVNCGLFWALACIWLIYDDVKIPHLKGEAYKGNSSYVPIYTNYIPTEFLINGIVSALLTVVNVICIFITAIIVLKIKEVAAPYTSSPDLRRFWETDIRAARKTNRSTIRRGGTMNKTSYDDLLPSGKNLESTLEQALKEASEDAILRKLKRISYSANAASELSDVLANTTATNGTINNVPPNTSDLALLDKLVTTLLEKKVAESSASSSPSSSQMSAFQKLRPLSRTLSRSFRLGSLKRNNNNSSNNSTLPTIAETSNGRRSATNNVKNVISQIKNAPHRFSTANDDDENKKLTRNVLE